MKRLNLLFFIFCLYSCVKQEKEEKKQINVQYEKASSFNEKYEIDSAFYYFVQAKDLAISQNDSLTAGKCLVNLAIISTNKKDDLIGQKFSLEAIHYLNEKKKENLRYISKNYNNLGYTCQNLRDYDEAFRFFDLAIKFSDNQENTNIFLNNKAYLYQETKQYRKALQIYELIKKKNIHNQIEFARTLANISFTKWLLNPNYKAASELLTSLSVREKENDFWGQNSSYYYLAEYYEKSRPDSALFYAHKMYKIAEKMNSINDQLFALQKLILLSPIKVKNDYFKQYIKLDDSALVIRNKAKNQFALIRYKTEKHKSDFLKAQAENVEKQKNILLQNIGIGILIASLITGYFWYRRRQKIMKQEKELEVKNTELRYVKKVHDHVANRIYQVIDEIDNRPQMHKDEVAEKLDVIYHISRDLSYENIGTHYQQHFAKELSQMLSSYQSLKVAIKVNGNEEKLWHNVTETIKSEVYAILQELMTNMSKHSRASLVQLEFQTNNQQLTIVYTDNGKGIKDFSPGNGLRNTENRIKSISGLITFDTKPDQGLKVKISFPI